MADKIHNGGADPEPPAKPMRQPAFLVSIFRFQETIDALHQLHEEVCVHAAELDRERFDPEALSAVKSLASERRARFKQWIEENVKVAATDEAPANDDAILARPLDDELVEIFTGNPAAANQAQLLLQRAVVTPNRQMLLRSSLLTMAVSAFEVLLGALASRHYELHPGNLSNDRRFSFKEISAFDSLDEVQDAAIAHRVYQLLQEPLDQWSKWLDKDSGLGVKLENLAIDFPLLVEIIQRRHVIVHNGGVVSQQYLDRMSFDGDPPAIGAHLHVSQAYLTAALEQLDTAGNLTAVGVWAKERPDLEGQAVSVLSNRMEQLLFDGRWPALRKICSIGKKIASFELQANVFKVNEWLAIKRIEGLDGIKAEIRDNWDTTALEPQFRLVELALLDLSDAFFQQAPTTLANGRIHPEQLKIWPVFDELREDARFADLLAGKQDLSKGA